MLSRKIHDKKATDLADSIKNNIKDLFNNTYQSDLKSENKKIHFFSFLYPSEIIFVFSLISKHDNSALPITLFLSLETQKKSSNPSGDSEKRLIDEAGHFFDDFFHLNEEDQRDVYTENWQLVDADHEDLFFKVSRENVELSVKADQLLGE